VGWRFHCCVFGEGDHAHFVFCARNGVACRVGQLWQRPARRSRPGRTSGPQGRCRSRRAGRASWSAGPAGRKRTAGPPSPSIRVIRSDCVSGCSVECQDNEVLITAYCGATRNQAQFLSERGVSCGPVPSAANTPLVGGVRRRASIGPARLHAVLSSLERQRVRQREIAALALPLRPHSRRDVTAPTALAASVVRSYGSLVMAGAQAETFGE
jgi:hypothetical protein